MKSLFIFILSVMVSVQARALSPMSGYNDLVAGEGTEGMEDGPFYSALFRAPQGLALDSAARKIYLTDRKNNRIRVIDLAQANKVSTLVGKGPEGFADGPLNSALFKQPSFLVLLSGRRLAVFDSGNARIRLIDLSLKTVSTLAGSGVSGSADGIGVKAQVSDVQGMTYLDSQKALYFSQANPSVLRKVDLKTGSVSTVFKDTDQIHDPGALCAHEGNLYLADLGIGGVFELTPKKNPVADGQAFFDAKKVAEGKSIRTLAWGGKTLYAVQNDPVFPLMRLLPQSSPVSFMSVWGDPMPANQWNGFFLGFSSSIPPCLEPDPLSEGKFYLANPQSNIVVSFRDLNQFQLRGAEERNSSGITEFEYPLQKPAGTFRVLVVGDSRSFHAFKNDNDKRGWDRHNRMAGLSKRLEFTLNALGSLQDASVKFEVLHQGEVSWNPLNIWTYYAVPGTVEKYDIDLVLYLWSPYHISNMSIYYERPLTDQQIPAEKVDPEYLLKPALERIAPGLPKKMFDLLLAKKFIPLPTGGNIGFPDLDAIMGDEEILDCFSKMYARPIRLLREKLESRKTLQGRRVRMEMCLFPTLHFEALGRRMPFYKKVLEETGAHCLNFLDNATALKLSFYPLSEIESNDHMSADGHMFTALILAHELIREKVIPFGAEEQNKAASGKPIKTPRNNVKGGIPPREKASKP